MTQASSPRHSDVWDLSPLFTPGQDRAIEEAMAQLPKDAAAFEKKYKGQIATAFVTRDSARQFLRDYDSICLKAGRLGSYASLQHSANTTNAAAESLRSRVREISTITSQKTLFAYLEMQDVPAASLDALLADADLSRYHYALTRLKKRKEHTLSQEIEEVILDKNMTGRSAWVDLVSNHHSRLEFAPVKRSDGTVATTEAELHALREDKDRSIRQAAYTSLIAPLRDHSYLYSFAWSKVIQDCQLENARRKFSSTLEAQLFDHEVDRTTFDTLMAVCEETIDVPQRFIALKAKRLGLGEIRPWDTLAPLGSKAPKISWDESVDLVLRSAERFSPTFHKHILSTVEERRIDARIRPGKRGGAFCASPYASEPFVLMSFADDYKSLFTLAHELGHAVHGALSTAAQPYFCFHASLVTCELASILNEFLLTDAILAENPPRDVKEYLLLGKAQETMGTFYRQARISLFEQKAHEAQTKSPLDAANIGDLWVKTYYPMLGASFKPSELSPFDWSYIQHVFFEPFYCYNYALSFAVSLACYEKYKAEGANFVRVYEEALRIGGSQSPRETLKPLGIDLHDPETYRSVARYMRKTLDQLESLGE